MKSVRMYLSCQRSYRIPYNKIGVNFSSDTRNIERWIVEEQTGDYNQCAASEPSMVGRGARIVGPVYIIRLLPSCRAA